MVYTFLLLFQLEKRKTFIQQVFIEHYFMLDTMLAFRNTIL